MKWKPQVTAIVFTSLVVEVLLKDIKLDYHLPPQAWEITLNEVDTSLTPLKKNLAVIQNYRSNTIRLLKVRI